MAKKLTITGITSPDSHSGTSFSCMLAPENFKHNRSVEVQEKKVGDTAGPVTQFQSYGSESLDIEIVIDGTGFNNPTGGGMDGGAEDVDAQVDKLVDICYNYKGDIHKPYYLLVEWSKFAFVGQLKSFDVDFTLFDKDGNPLRAKAKLSITIHKDPGSNGSSGRSSPDMTHVKTVRVGDSLPLLCKEVYGKMHYYLQVAEHNGLTNFRELEIGENLEFPPLER